MKQRVLKSRHVVMSYELDAFGHVNNAVFLNYLEKARNDYLVERGLCFNDFFEWKKYPIVVRANLHFHRPARAGDHLIINGWVSDHGAASFTLRYEILNENTKQLVLSGETFHVFVNDDNRPSRIPVPFRTKFFD